MLERQLMYYRSQKYSFTIPNQTTHRVYHIVCISIFSGNTIFNSKKDVSCLFI